MVQVIPQVNRFSELGRSFGEGLGAQIPKEVERYRLKQGLKSFQENAKGLSPVQQLAELSTIPGITDQMVHSFSKLLKNENTRNAFQAAAQKAGGLSTQGNKEAPQGEINYGTPRGGQNYSLQGENAPMGQDKVMPNEYGQPQIVNQNPLREEAVPKARWSQDRYNQEVAQLAEDYPYEEPEQIRKLAAEKEARELAQPEDFQKRDEYLKKQLENAESRFTDILGEKLQKNIKGDSQDVYKDITGEMLNNLKRGMARELRLNPGATIDDVANKWSEYALDLSKTKSQLDKDAANTGAENFFQKDKMLNKLKAYQKIFAKTGNQEEFYNILKSKFTMSPEGAASIAFPTSKGVNAFIEKIPNKPFNLTNRAEIARKYASEIEKIITRSDSILAIVNKIKEKDLNFSDNAFFEQLTSDLDDLALTPRQQREVSEGSRNITPTWGDVFISPLKF